LKIFNSIPEAKLRPNLVTYSAVISSLEKSRALWQLALHFFQQLKVSSWSPDVISYNATISCCGAAGEWQPALSLLRNMVDSSISPTVVTYTSTIHSFTAKAEWQRALVLWQQMHQTSLASNFTAVSSMLDVLGGSTSKSAESVATAMFEAALRAKIFEDLVSAGQRCCFMSGKCVKITDENRGIIVNSVIHECT
jgi:pentatricopeptide repeat protein